MHFLCLWQQVVSVCTTDAEVQTHLLLAWLCWCFMWCDCRCGHSSFCSGQHFRWLIKFVALFSFCGNDFAAYFADNHCSVSFWNQLCTNLQRNKPQYMELFVLPDKASPATTEASLTSLLTNPKTSLNPCELSEVVEHSVYIFLSLFAERCVPCTAD